MTAPGRRVPPQRGRVGRWARVALAGLLALVPLAILPTAATAAGGVRSDLPTRTVTVTITRIAPAALQPTSTLIIAGTVTNVSGGSLDRLSLDLGKEETVLTRARLDEIRASPAPAVPFTIPKALRTLAAGASGAFVLQVPDAATALGLTEDRVSQLAVLVTAAGTLLGQAELPLPYFPTGLESPLHVAIVLPVTAPPDQGPVAPAGPSTRQPPSPALLAALSPGGRLDVVVKAALRAGASGGVPATHLTLAVDPALLTRVCALAAECAETQVSPGASLAQSQVARSWLEELQQAAALPTVDLVGLPYGDADLAAMAAAGDGADAGQLLAAANREVHGVLTQAAASSFEPLLPDGALTPALADVARQVGVTTAVLSDTQARPVTPTAPAPPTETASARLGLGSGDPVSALVTDAGLEALFAPSATGEDLGQVQDLLAELGVITSERPSNPAVRTVVLEAPRAWNVSLGFATSVIDQLASARYVVSVPLQAAATEVAGRRTLVAPDSSRLLPATTIASVQRLQGAVTELRQLAATPRTEQLSGPLFEQLQRALSVSWRGTGAATGAALLTAVSNLLPVNTKVIQLGANRSGVLLTGASGTLPVAINNGLQETVHLIVLVQSDPPGQVTGSLSVTLRAGQPSQQLNIPITARSTRQVAVVVSVHPFAAQQAPALASKTVPVRSTAVGVVAVSITAGALTVLVLAIVFRLGRKLHRRRLTAAA